ncbi:MAG TPA: orotidine-5'-phosphate decarboxylase [Pseudonocardiaceae bacterium]|nr:orotidine-5'-phosphate decarboxylase [Pseudonocardiaceae bacterium]
MTDSDVTGDTTDLSVAGFGARLAAAMAARGPLCAGIDPHPGLLRDWGLADDIGGLERFALGAAEALAPEVAVLKPQSAFFERHGAQGMAVLERVLHLVRDAGALVLLDVKRGDIGSTMTGYAEAFLAEDAPLGADAITVSPYLGVGALEPAFELASRTGRGVFVLALTSNPEGADVQSARTGNGATVAQSVIDAVAARNLGYQGLGDLGVVIGATSAPAAVRLEALGGPVLAPGIGAQGATLADLHRVFGAAVRHVLPAISRELLRHGPVSATLRSAARRVADEAAAVLVPPSWQVEGGTPR